MSGQATVMPRPRKLSPPLTASVERVWFGKNLRRERMQQGLTLEDLAERSGMTWSYISHIERGMRNIAIDNMAALAGAVNKPLMDLLAQPVEDATDQEG